jgi:hypothetical protein
MTQVLEDDEPQKVSEQVPYISLNNHTQTENAHTTPIASSSTGQLVSFQNENSQPGSLFEQDMRGGQNSVSQMLAPAVRAMAKVMVYSKYPTTANTKDATVNVGDTPTPAPTEANVLVTNEVESRGISEIRTEDAILSLEGAAPNTEAPEIIKIESEGEGPSQKKAADERVKGGDIINVSETNVTSETGVGGSTPAEAIKGTTVKIEADSIVTFPDLLLEDTTVKSNIETTDLAKEKAGNIFMAEQVTTAISDLSSPMTKIESNSAELAKSKLDDAATMFKETNKSERSSLIKAGSKGMNTQSTEGKKQMTTVTAKEEPAVQVEKETITPVQEIMKLLAKFPDSDTPIANSDTLFLEAAIPVEKENVVIAPDIIEKPVDIPEPNTLIASPEPLLLEAYNNLFLIYYSFEPSISTTDILLALKESSLLVKVAETYGSLPIVRPYINSALFAFGRDLYKSIAKDPPTWMVFAAKLRSAVIFQGTFTFLLFCRLPGA